MISAERSYDLVILGSGIAGLAGALAAHEFGLQSEGRLFNRSKTVVSTLPVVAKQAAIGFRHDGNRGRPRPPQHR